MQKDGASVGVKKEHANCVKITAIESLGNRDKIVLEIQSLF